MKARWVIPTLAVVLLMPVGARAEGPSKVLEAYIDQVVEVFEKASLQDDQEDVHQLKHDLQVLAEQAFSYQIMARMSLGSSWKRFDPAQQEEFVQLFTRMLEETYFSKIRKYFQEIKSYSREQVVITDEIIFSSRKAEVQTEMEHEGTKVPVHYRMVTLNGDWKVYDVQVEGVSLVQNYRSQFQDLMLKHSPEEVIEIVRKKVEDGSSEELSDIVVD